MISRAVIAFEWPSVSAKQREYIYYLWVYYKRQSGMHFARHFGISSTFSFGRADGAPDESHLVTCSDARIKAQ